MRVAPETSEEAMTSRRTALAASTRTQVLALTKKNVRIHTRTSLWPCQCGCFNMACNACCMHFFCPIIFTAMITALPWILLKSTLSDPDAWLRVDTDPPAIQNPDWQQLIESGMQVEWDPVREEQRAGLQLHSRLFSWNYVEEYDTRGEDDEDECEAIVRSCFCKTLAVVADESTFDHFKTFMEGEYSRWYSAQTQGLISNCGQRVLDEQPELEEEEEEEEEDGAKLAQLRKWLKRSKFGQLHKLLEFAAPTPPKVRQQKEARRLQFGCSQEPQLPGLCNFCDVQGPEYSHPIFRRFSSQDAVDDWVDSKDYGRYDADRSENSAIDRLCGAIIFENNPIDASIPKVIIRPNVTSHDANSGGEPLSRSLTVATFSESNKEKDVWHFYYKSAFLSMQHMTNMFIAGQRNVDASSSIYTTPVWNAMPTGEERSWGFGEVVASIIGNPIILSMMFGSIISAIAYYTSRERSQRQRELMRMMGLSDGSLLLSWLLMFVGINFLMSFFLALLFIIFFFNSTQFLLVWMAFFFFANASVALGLLVAALISSERNAAMLAFGLFVGCSFAVFGVTVGTSRSTKNAIALLPPAGFLMTLEALYLWENLEVDNTFENASNVINNFAAGDGLGLLFLAFWLYLGLYYYIDQVAWWHDVGVPRKLWFFVMPSYWKEIFGISNPQAESKTDEPYMDRGLSDKDKNYFQPEEDMHMKQMVTDGSCVRVQDLCRSFKNASGDVIKAVNGLSLTMYQDECFCLLGHNGAGKTTTMMMITGCLPQTSGRIQVKGHQIPEDVREVRSSMGFCPQHNVLWDELTCYEHLEFFGRIGGMTIDALKQRGTELLRSVALLDKMHARASTLSGGMKRKLSCAIAFLSEPYLVILDEPSAGMDPFARRGMWDTLKLWRTGHILCLTTHYMDEADALGDRIVIMSQGKAACRGTSLFLKQAFGLGYIISIVKSKEGVDEKIMDFLRRYLGSGIAVQSAIGKELLVQVPFAQADKFPELFAAMDNEKDDLGIEAYGTSVTNLEEVFLKVADKEKAERKLEQGGTEAPEMKAPRAGEANVLQSASFGLQFYALFMRRCSYALRNRLSVMLGCMLPLCCMIWFVLIIALTIVLALPKLYLDTWNFNLEVEKGPLAPATVGAAMSYDQDMWQAAWEQQASVDVVGWYEHAWGTGNYPGPVDEEGDFLYVCYQNRELYEASQYIAVYYPHMSDFETAVEVQRPILVHNLTSYHSTPIAFAVHSAVQLRSGTAGTTSPIENIEYYNFPFQLTQKERDEVNFFSGIFLALVLMVAFGFLPAGVTAYIVMEKEKDVKSQLLISGCSHSAYWLSSFVFDSLFALLPAAGTIIIFFAFKNIGTAAFAEAPGYGASMALFVVFGPAMSGMAYLTSFFFSKSGMALFVTWLFNTAFAVLASTIITVLGFFNSLYDIKVVLRWLCRLVPAFSLGYGHFIISIYQPSADQENVGALAGLAVGGTWCTPKDEVDGEYIDDNQCIYMVGDEFLFLAVFGFVFVAATLLVDLAINTPALKKKMAFVNMSRFQSTQSGDEMVKAEIDRVKDVDGNSQFVYVKDIHKVYGGRVHAVRGISFAAAEGQVFGLLGVNGAGKTTTFKMLCGQEAPTSGEVRIQGLDVSVKAGEARKHIGYCPQFNALLDSLTTVEHLYLFGRLKGLSGERLKEAVDAALTDLDLHAFVNSRAGQLSGGNKRKVNVGMATIGEPPMVFLDEPSAGMDPVARRGMWSVIQDIAEKRKKSVVILTTHSMEEAEALCSRIAIQVDGQFRCLGSAQQIKSKYGLGLELNVRLATPSRKEIADALSKMSLTAEQVVPANDALQLTTTHYGQAISEELRTRAGSPLLASATVSSNVLAEWAILVQRTHVLEGFMATQLGAEIPAGATDRSVAVPLEKAQNVIRYQLQPQVLQGKFKSIGACFALFQENREALLIDDFQVCQTTLEQIFNHFASTQVSQVGQGRGAAAAIASEQGAAQPQQAPQQANSAEAEPVA